MADVLKAQPWWGASPRETSPGRAVLRNLGSAGFEGSVSLVNPVASEKSDPCISMV
jgi:hypothetical protein